MIITKSQYCLPIETQFFFANSEAVKLGLGLAKRLRTAMETFQYWNLKRWGQASSDLCECGETQTMSHLVDACPLTRLEGGLQALHEAGEAAVEWLKRRL